MNEITPNTAPVAASSEEVPAYHKPQLKVLGAVAELTKAAAGSGAMFDSGSFPNEYS